MNGGSTATDDGRRAPHDELTSVVREHAGRLAASLVNLTGDFSAAEDLVQEAVVTALRRWPVDGIPHRPDAWLFAVARNRGLDAARRAANYARKLEQLDVPAPPEPDERLRLIFTCCHPALPRAAQIALTLRVVCGLTTAQIARAFLVPEATVAQRITRAKRKIAAARIPYRMPDLDELDERLDEVLAVIYLLLNEGYLSTAGRAQSRDLVDDAEWLASLLHTLMPTEPEVAGLLALVRLHQARGAARFDPDGSGPDSELVLLADQDRSRWDHQAIAQASQLLASAIRQRRPGPYQLQAAIAACHAETERWSDTDWEQIVVLRHAPPPGPVPGRAAAPGHRPALRRGPRGGARRPGRAGRRPRPVPPLPRHPRRAAPGSGPSRRGPGGRPPGSIPDQQPRRAGPPPATPHLGPLTQLHSFCERDVVPTRRIQVTERSGTDQFEGPVASPVT